MSVCCSPQCAKVAGYMLYIAGGSVTVGLYRTAKSSYYIYHHSKKAEAYRQAHRALKAKLEAENTEAKRKRKEAKNLLSKTWTLFAEVWTQGENKVEEIASLTEKNALRYKEEAQKILWYTQLARGIIELVPVIGAFGGIFLDKVDPTSGFLGTTQHKLLEAQEESLGAFLREGLALIKDS